MAKKKNLNTQKDLNVHIVLDRSGSMNSCRASTIDGVNEYLNTIRLDGKTATKVSLTTFDDQSVDLVWNRRDPAGLNLTRDDFIPRGMTPLNDAIGKTIAHIDSIGLKESELVALVVMTDGLENASKEFTKQAIAARIKDKTDAGWLVIYLGANQDAWAEGAARGTSFANTMSYTTNNTTDTLRAAAEATMLYAASGSAAKSAFTDDQRKRAAR